MKHFSFCWLTSALTVALCAIMPTSHSFTQDFQRGYGTNLDNTFSKVVKDGTNYYVLGQDEPVNGSSLHATVTRLDANGIHQWTLRLNIPSVWNDAVLTPSGDLMVVGSTLPFDVTSKSLIGLVTSSGGGNFDWVRSYDVTGRESNTHIVRSPNPQNAAFPYYIVGSQFDSNGGDLWDDIFLLNINEFGSFNWKKRFPSIDDDEFARNLDVMPNGDLILSGNKDNLGVILLLDNSGTLIAGAAPDAIQFSYADVTPISGGGFYAVGGTFPSFTAHLIKYDADLLEVWNATISGLTSVSQVWEESSSGVIYVVGSGVFNGVNRGVVLLFTVFGQTPILQWVKFPDNNESFYVEGSITLLSGNEFAFVDGRSSTSAGFGQQDAFISVHDLQFATCITDEDFVNVNPVSLTYIAPFLPEIEFFDFSIGTDILSSALNWQQEEVCNNNPCHADFIITPIGNCGHYQVTNTSTGAQPLTYSWCNGMDTQNLDVMLSCGPHTFCLTITDANGCTSTAEQTVTVSDIIPPVARCVPSFGMSLDANCEAILTPFLIDGGSTDNCQIQSISISPAVLSGCGFFPVTLTVTDWCGNTDTCVTMIQTNEVVPPVIRCPDNITLTATGPDCAFVVNGLEWVVLMDNCGTPIVTYSVAGASSYTGFGTVNGLSFNQGISTVTYIATDDCGNSAECSFEVFIDCECNCANNMLQNPGFFEGASPGNNLGFSGQSNHWVAGSLSPQVVQEDSCCDAYSIQMWGYYYNGEAIRQQGLNIQAGHHYKITFCARYLPGNSNVNSINFGFNAASSPTDPYNCQPCEQIGLSPQITSTSWATYTMPIWTPTQNHSLVYIRAVSITGYQSWGRIDNICIEEVPYACCADEEAFVENADNAIHVYVDERTREVVFDAGNLPECDSIASIDWGDGNITPGPLSGNSIRRNRLLDHLLARVQYEVIEYDQNVDPAVPCFQHLFMDSVKIGSPDTCFVGGFSEVLIREAYGASGQLIGCDEIPLVLSCPDPGVSSTVSGLFQCIGDDCPGGWPVAWTLTRSGDEYSGIVMANPYFTISLLPHYINQPGVYVLTLDASCGIQSSTCEFQFIIDCPDLCPCTPETIAEFRKERDMLFAKRVSAGQGCSVILSPNGLSDCETVEWFIQDTLGAPIGITEGNNSLSYDFLEPGNYTVITVVTKKKDDGSKCDKLMRTQNVTVTCQTSPDCVDTDIDNPSFSIGAHFGGLNSGGTSRGWNSISGDAEVVEGTAGSLDGWTILLSGNRDTADVLSRAEGICHNKGPGVFTAHVKSTKSNTSDRISPSKLKVLLGRGWSFPPTWSVKENKCEGIDCYEIGTVPLPSSETGEWFDIQIPFDLSRWAALDSCNDFAGILIRPVIYVTNDLGSNQGGENTYSYVELDNVCFTSTIVAVHDPISKQGLRLYPNPTNGSLTVEHSTPAASGLRLRIISLTGQILIEKKAEIGSNIQSLETNELSEGMYLLQIISEGQMVSIEKFVKH